MSYNDPPMQTTLTTNDSQADLPARWQTRVLADCAAIQTGATKGAHIPREEAIEVPYLRVANVQNGHLDLTEIKLLPIRRTDLETYRLRPDDVVLTEGGDFDKLGRGSIWEGQIDPCIHQNHIFAVRVNQDLLTPRYFAYFVQSAYSRSYFLKVAHKTTNLACINSTKLKALPVRIPPLEEQEKIAAILWKVQRAIEVEDKLIATTRELKQSAMRQLFTRGLRGEPQKETPYGFVPQSWQIKPLLEWAHVQTGATKGRKIPPEEAIEVPYLRVANVQDGRLDLAEMKTILIRRDELAGYRLQSDDVVLTEGGDFDKLGRGFIWESQVEPCIHQNHIFAVRVNREVLWPRYFAYLAQSSYGKAYFLQVAHKTTNLACINTTKLRAFPVLRPELDEQKQIATILQTLDRKISLHERKRATLSDLFQTLLHQLMTAQIRVPDLEIDTSQVENI